MVFWVWNISCCQRSVDREAHMDKGILRFMAEAYLLLHSGAVAQQELRADGAATATLENKSQHESRGCATQSGESRTIQAPDKQQEIKR